MTDLDIAIKKQRAVIADLDVKVSEAEKALDDTFAELHGALNDLDYMMKLKRRNARRRDNNV